MCSRFQGDRLRCTDSMSSNATDGNGYAEESWKLVGRGNRRALPTRPALSLVLTLSTVCFTPDGIGHGSRCSAVFRAKHRPQSVSHFRQVHFRLFRRRCGRNPWAGELARVRPVCWLGLLNVVRDICRQPQGKAYAIFFR